MSARSLTAPAAHTETQNAAQKRHQASPPDDAPAGAKPKVCIASPEVVGPLPPYPKITKLDCREDREVNGKVRLQTLNSLTTLAHVAAQLNLNFKLAGMQNTIAGMRAQILAERDRRGGAASEELPNLICVESVAYTESQQQLRDAAFDSWAASPEGQHVLQYSFVADTHRHLGTEASCGKVNVDLCSNKELREMWKINWMDPIANNYPVALLDLRLGAKSLPGTCMCANAEVDEMEEMHREVAEACVQEMHRECLAAYLDEHPSFNSQTLEDMNKTNLKGLRTTLGMGFSSADDVDAAGFRTAIRLHVGWEVSSLALSQFQAQRSQMTQSEIKNVEHRVLERGVSFARVIPPLQTDKKVGRKAMCFVDMLSCLDDEDAVSSSQPSQPHLTVEYFEQQASNFVSEAKVSAAELIAKMKNKYNF